MGRKTDPTTGWCWSCGRRLQPPELEQLYLKLDHVLHNYAIPCREGRAKLEEALEFLQGMATCHARRT